MGHVFLFHLLYAIITIAIEFDFYRSFFFFLHLRQKLDWHVGLVIPRTIIIPARHVILNYYIIVSPNRYVIVHVVGTRTQLHRNIITSIITIIFVIVIIYFAVELV